MYAFTNPSTRAGCDTRSILTVWIQGFPSPRSVVMPRLKSLVCLCVDMYVFGRVYLFYCIVLFLGCICVCCCCSVECVGLFLTYICGSFLFSLYFVDKHNSLQNILQGTSNRSVWISYVEVFGG